ncbi:F0F1 ATP synthase subunit B [Blochmannia endosymbiont of Camponotus sp. C-003]|uniref:F0F1 ATP synthase subunit B n=1 Tax=unclassified Candidatus Blochmanniella TaxID=711328 RepID=UPI0020242B46|nr:MULTISPECIES: F0F1 ATP synthase subunit B [unclassified Candidatus Blochmannia]URJ23221.1 F0F1 ATP synthase subunit B [Blochmannia endosymbiont of Camponotus sp. C-003]URJ28690.1 F0F1 ATP synthase subunit B [Blochmannia endosymbiont of Camponotus sp. C-046]
MNLNATILGQTISFILFVWFCMRYVWYPFMSIIEKRQKEISDNLASATHARTESDRVNAEALICLRQARIKAQYIINQANICKMQIINEAKHEAEKEQSRILSQAREQILYERKCVIDELRKQIGNLVIEGIEKIIEHSITEMIDTDLVNNIINTLSHED